MGNYGVKIAKAGYGYSEGDNRLVYNSKYPLLKMKAHGTGTLTLSGGAGSKTVYTHSLGYAPFFYVWISYIDTATGNEVAKKRLCSWSEYLGLQRSDVYIATSDASTVELVVDTSATYDIIGGSGTATLDYVYVVFYDPI
jgi:hypothetical protein